MGLDKSYGSHLNMRGASHQSIWDIRGGDLAERLPSSGWLILSGELGVKLAAISNQSLDSALCALSDSAHSAACCYSAAQT